MQQAPYQLAAQRVSPLRPKAQKSPYLLLGRLVTVLALIAFQPLLAKDSSDALSLQRLSGKTMGTQYHIKFYGASQLEALQADIDQTLVGLNREVSTYIVDSEISRFNRAPAKQWFEVSHHFYTITEAAKKVHKLTQGAFDPTIGALVNLWGFGPQGTRRSVPEPAVIQSTLNKIGFDKVLLRASPRSIQRQSDEIYLDLSAIAKGYGVDLIAEMLESRKIVSYMVEIGGEVRTRGKKANGKPWVIGIEKPAALARQSLKPVRPGSKALATSGDYRNYFESKGQRYSHLIDPRTGTPIQHRLASVSVLADTCAEADALATAFMVLGTEATLAIAERHAIPVFLLVRGKNGFEERSSKAMHAFFLNP